MRIILKIAIIILAFSANLSAQNDFMALDKRTYDYYLKGDYKNLKIISDTMLSQGIDYYYLRMRLGVLSFNKQLYSSASDNFTRAIEFNLLDTVSMEYIYNSYLFSGRSIDAVLYLESIPQEKRTNMLKSIRKPVFSDFFIGSYISGSGGAIYNPNNLYTEIANNNLSFNAGFESNFTSSFKGTFALTNFRKTGTIYYDNNLSTNDLNVIQNQVYAKLTGYVFPGWEFSGFGHIAFFSDVIHQKSSVIGSPMNQKNTEYIGGVGISKNGWKIRSGVNISLSNFINSNQLRGEGYLTWLPAGNLNLYLTSGGMYQTDYNWGKTYQINQEIGFRIIKSLWMESGIIKGNSFLYARNQGYLMNNSFLIPTTTIYSSIIILPGKQLSITITPFLSENNIYSWDLKAYKRIDKLTLQSFGGSIKLTYKNR